MCPPRARQRRRSERQFHALPGSALRCNMRLTVYPIAHAARHAIIEAFHDRVDPCTMRAAQ